MQRIMLKSKIHRANITEANLYYEGSFTIDAELMELADIKPYEKIAVVNINNGERFETYAIEGLSGSRVFCLNGAAARKGQIGDEVIIITYSNVEEADLNSHVPTIILVDKNNNPISKMSITEPNKIYSSK